MPTDFVRLFGILAAARVRFVVVCGLALLLHGLDRLTADVGLVIDLSADAARDAVRALTGAGYAGALRGSEKFALATLAGFAALSRCSR